MSPPFCIVSKKAAAQKRRVVGQRVTRFAAARARQRLASGTPRAAQARTAGARLGDGAQILLQLLLGHANAAVADGQHAALLVQRDLGKQSSSAGERCAAHKGTKGAHIARASRATATSSVLLPRDSAVAYPDVQLRGVALAQQRRVRERQEADLVERLALQVQRSVASARQHAVLLATRARRVRQARGSRPRGAARQRRWR